VLKKKGILQEYNAEIFMARKTGVSIMYAPHIHRNYELYFCPENITQRTVICGKEYEYTYPSAIISKPYTIHSMSCLEDCKTDFLRYVFYFNESVLQGLGIDLFPEGVTGGELGVLFRLKEEEAKYLSSVLDAIIASPMSETECSLIFSFVVRKLYSFCQDGRITGVGASNAYVQEVIKYITEHFSENINIADVAAYFAVSRSKLERDFKEGIGEAPKAFLESCRLGEAKNLLMTTNMPVSEIAMKSGFSSENYFFRFFKNHTGISPLRYRKTAEEKERVRQSRNSE